MFFGKPSLMTCIAVGKLSGFLIGLLGFIMIPVVLPDVSMMMRLGIVFWYTTVGAVVGMFSVCIWHPVLRMPMPWWFRGSILGAWMNFVLTLFVYDNFKDMMAQMGLWFESPFWFVLEGALVGLLIAWLARYYGGEGRETVADMS